MDDTIWVKAHAKRNGLTTLIIGGLGLLLSAAWLAWMPSALFLAGIFLCSAALVTLLIGWFKCREPVHSLAISRQGVRFHHRVGQWFLPWQHIQRIDSPRLTSGLEQQALDVVGIKISDYGAFIATLSPRLANHLLQEQRPLLLGGEGCDSGQCYSENLLEPDRFKLASGEWLTGIQAMFAHRMKRFRERWGYDVFISASALDRDTPSFVALLRQCHDQVRLDPPEPDGE
ncbi:DUF2982 domain-containing protein [Aestuariibacter halophilus]|uniref:DUF2982 domain-containing protein n=1 Tax=Fluctibacter halophilus TaxID=226011 RepID=A0ABS8GC49_9ALTE|nr:DUF2982 domain-containing protein [Aestuariibacter halophilus]MCC2617400.1 DUF2982 domain-containing protein [Aestuariibacter halophilus]